MRLKMTNKWWPESIEATDEEKVAMFVRHLSNRTTEDLEEIIAAIEKIRTYERHHIDKNFDEALKIIRNET